MLYGEIAAGIVTLLLVINIIWTIVTSKYKLPANVIKYKNLLDSYGAKMVVLLTEASALKTDLERRNYVTKKLKAIGTANGVDIPDYVLNVLVEFAYSKYKIITAK